MTLGHASTLKELHSVLTLSELQRIIPGKWQWEIKEHDDNSFIAEFPKKIEKQRAVAFGGADVRAEGVPSRMRLKFEEWHEKE